MGLDSAEEERLLQPLLPDNSRNAPPRHSDHSDDSDEEREVSLSEESSQILARFGSCCVLRAH